MILFLGTSSLIKLYVEEKDSETVRRWVHDAEIVATSRIAFTEIIDALELRLSAQNLSSKDYDMIMKRLSDDWPHYAAIDFDDREAGLFIQKYHLNRFDAIQLSAAKTIARGNNSISISFSSADAKLRQAAEHEGLNVLHFS